MDRIILDVEDGVPVCLRIQRMRLVAKASGGSLILPSALSGSICHYVIFSAVAAMQGFCLRKRLPPFGNDGQIALSADGLFRLARERFGNELCFVTHAHLLLDPTAERKNQYFSTEILKPTGPPGNLSGLF